MKQLGLYLALTLLTAGSCQKEPTFTPLPLETVAVGSWGRYVGNDLSTLYKFQADYICCEWDLPTQNQFECSKDWCIQNGREVVITQGDVEIARWKIVVYTESALHVNVLVAGKVTELFVLERL